MEQRVIDFMLSQVRARLEEGDWTGAASIIEALRPPDQADLFSELEPGLQEDLLPRLDVEDAADIMEELDDEEAVDLAGRLSVNTLASILNEMESDEVADLLGDMEPEQASQVLALIDDPEDVLPLMLHPDETAGGLMTSEFIALREGMKVFQAMNAIRSWGPENPAAVHYLFVVDSENHLCGIVDLLSLIRAGQHQTLREIMSPDVISVQVDVDQETCAQLMSRYDLYAMPVIDAEHHLMGVITVDDLVSVLVEEQSEDIQRLGATVPLDKPYLDTPVWQVAGKRVGWLLLLFITGTLTGSVMRHFEGLLAREVALTFFVPLLIGTGGNAGAQTTATIIRSLALGEIRIPDAMKVFWHECRVGLLLGTMMGIAAFVRAITWTPNIPLAIAVSLAVLTIVLWANCIGSLLPVLAARFRIDPTVVSGPFMSTLVDATGLFIYLSIALLILGL